MLETGLSLSGDGEEIIISGASTLGNIRALRELILTYKVKDSLEIGLAYGASALAVLKTLKEVHGDDCSHSAIDPFQNCDYKGSALRAIRDEGTAPYFKFYEDYSAFVLPSLVKSKNKYDLIYVDGSHLFEDVFIDLYYASRLLNMDGFLLFDDSRDPHIRKVISFIRKNFQGIFKEMDYSKIDDPKKSAVKRWGNTFGIRQLTGFIKVNEPARTWNAPFMNF